MDSQVRPISIIDALEQFEQWLANYRDLSPHTVRAYVTDVRALAKDIGEWSPVADIEPETVVTFLEAQRREHDDVLRRERELVAGHGDLRFAGLLAVSADSPERLDDACGAIETAATQALVDVRRLVGEQAEAFTAAALPLARGLR